MARQVAAFLTLLALTLAAAYFLQIAIVAKGRFEFGVADIVSCESGLLFALAGGVISRRYAFAAVVGVTYAAFWALAIHHLTASTGGGWVLDILAVNAVNIAASVLAGIAGACLGVFLRNRKRARP
ncbi:hypothetical protein [Stenotrophomonas sp. HMWF003]|uniref:hypothetical protein n=1 Tax=Stenotrophomonas sp. HMWF003 TaxID=2056840 RepID=UPI000D457FC6|nr:hypothetical protein [Stenotrophomonas sp. HMWF003]PTT59355.1 hypothetical protein DBR34_15125 [Stenotrophomonas sp. HMWF003]